MPRYLKLVFQSLSSSMFLLSQSLGLSLFFDPQERCSDAAVVFDTVDLHFLREQREAAYKDHYRRHASSAQPGGYSSSDPLADGTPLNEGDSGGMLDAVFGHRSREGGGASASSAAGALRERLLTRSKAARSQV